VTDSAEGRPCLVGYARISTRDQDPGLQITALQKAGIERLFLERASGAIRDRPELERCLSTLQPGDTLMVWRLDRLGRSLQHLLSILESLQARGVHFRSLTENIETETATGRLVLQVFGALAEFERALLRERTLAGLAELRRKGLQGPGRPSKLNRQQLILARRLLSEGQSIRATALALGIARSTLYDSLRREVDRLEARAQHKLSRVRDATKVGSQPSAETSAMVRRFVTLDDEADGQVAGIPDQVTTSTPSPTL
jgi:DNA invertase Pin-like site-specific DNA recombinase